MNKKELLDKINERRAVLEKARVNLKSYFVGLDQIIDDIIQNIESWYIFPEAITRPIIINLWGMTGVGKTDLIRRLVSELGMYDQFVEIQMDNTSTYSATIKDTLLSSNIEEGMPGILLLDEMQRFRTVAEDGRTIRQNDRFNDVWMILSDGKFTHDLSARQSVMEMHLDDHYYGERDDDEEEEEDENLPGLPPKKKRTPKEVVFKVSPWEARRFKRMLRLSASVEEIMKWDQDVRNRIVIEKLEQGTISNAYDFTKLLIVICGNIDEAYSMADDVHNADVEADTLHEFSKKVSVVTIKNALLRRFKAEQISRFGNTHIIYPALSKKNFEEIIRRRVEAVTTKFQQILGIEIHPDSSIYDIIYKNGVYPAQGVRPVFTTVASVFEAYLPYFLLVATEHDINQISVSYKQPYLWAEAPGMTPVRSLTEIKLDLDRLRNKASKDERALVSVHEAAHTVAYMALFKVVPYELKSAVTNYYRGYMLGHDISHTRKNIKEQLQVMLAGRIAEEMVFGISNASSGASNDIMEATMLAGNYVRSFAMGDTPGYVRAEGGEQTDLMLTYVDDTNADISMLLEEANRQVRNVLTQYNALLVQLSSILLNQSEISPEDLFELSKHHIEGLELIESKTTLYPNYSQMFEQYLSKK